MLGSEDEAAKVFTNILKNTFKKCPHVSRNYRNRDRNYKKLFQVKTWNFMGKLLKSLWNVAETFQITILTIVIIWNVLETVLERFKKADISNVSELCTWRRISR